MGLGVGRCLRWRCELLGVGGYGAAWLVELIRHLPAAGLAAAAAAEGGKQIGLDGGHGVRAIPSQLVLKVAVPNAVWKLKRAQGQQHSEEQQAAEDEEDELQAFRYACASIWKSEYNIMSACKGANCILACYGWGCGKMANGEAKHWLLLEYACHGSLQQQLVGPGGETRGLSFEQAREVVNDVAGDLTVANFHAHAIHQDVKPGNIMLCDPPAGTSLPHRPWVAKLGDWGISKQLSNPGCLGETLDHTPAYIAPEQREGHSHDVRLDCWQIGLLLLHIRLGLLPFYYLYSSDISEEEREQRRSGEELDNPDSPYHSLQWRRSL